MTQRERVLAAVARRPVDRPPVAFWQHVPEVDHTAEGLAKGRADDAPILGPAVCAPGWTGCTEPLR